MKKRATNWYSGQAENRPTEHEIVAHVVLPLLKALGWSEQLLAVEWHKIDMAVFWRTPTEINNCCLVCEAKSLGHGLQGTWKQARNYWSSLNLINCRSILLTDGARFYLYSYDDEREIWIDAPRGYFNVFKLRQRHIVPPNTNAVDTLIALTPSQLGR